jgi:hypothetical protein
MDILNKLKKDKKADSVFDSAIKKKEHEAAPGTAAKPTDMEVTQLSGDKAPPQEKPVVTPKEPAPKREFRTEGLHEFELDSLGIPDQQANLKLEYKAKVVALIDQEKYGEAIEMLMELQLKLSEKPQKST